MFYFGMGIFIQFTQKGKSQQTPKVIINSESFFFMDIVRIHDIILLLSYRNPTTGGGDSMEAVVSFLISVAAGIACRYISKWLDRHDEDKNKGNK